LLANVWYVGPPPPKQRAERSSGEEMASSVGGGGDPFTGGAQQRNLAPPGVGGGIGSANTRVSAPVAGVAPTQIKSARPNEGSNIGIPYSSTSKRIEPPCT
jgi:hypothetical protein